MHEDDAGQAIAGDRGLPFARQFSVSDPDKPGLRILLVQPLCHLQKYKWSLLSDQPAHPHDEELAVCNIELGAHCASKRCLSVSNRPAERR